MNKSRFYRTIIKASGFITFSSLVFIILYILIKGVPSLSLDLFSLKYSTENLSVMPSIITTILLIVLTLLIAIPIGVFTAFYLIEYGSKDNKFIKIVRMATETLSGIPSIVFGLFGMLFFVIKLDLKYSLLSGTLTMVIMVLPLIIRSTEEALMAVDNSLREASFALGSGKLRTIFKVVLPVAMPSILSGVILSIGRIVGETAALMFTLGTASKIPSGLLSSGRTLALHMYMLSSEGLNVDKSYATGVILLALIFIINFISTRLSNRVIKEEKND